MIDGKIIMCNKKNKFTIMSMFLLRYEFYVHIVHTVLRKKGLFRFTNSLRRFVNAHLQTTLQCKFNSMHKPTA